MVDLTRDITPDGTVQLGDLASVAAIKRLVADPRARTIRVLASCGCPMRAAGARAIASGRELVGLVALDLGSSQLDDEAIVALATAPNLQGIERLDLTRNRFGDPGLRALLAPTSFPKLRELAIDCDALARGGLARLLASGLASRLTTLDIPMAGLGDRHAAAIAQAPTLAGLTRLALPSNRLGPVAGRSLATARHLRSLVELDLGHNALGPTGIAALARARWLGSIERLGLRDTRLQAAGLRALAASRAFAGVRDLDLSANQLGDPEIALLGTAFPKLVRLNLDWNPLGPGAATALAKRRGLEALILSDPVDTHDSAATSGIGDAGAQTLAAARALASLVTLNLSQNAIHDEGALALAASPHLANLQRLELRWNNLSPVAVAAITKRFGARASVHHQRTAAPAEPPPPPPPPPPPARRRPVDRTTTLARLAKKPAFAAWRRDVDPPIREAAEAISRDAIAALLAQGKTPTRAADRRILKRFVARFDALDRDAQFIGTIEVEDIAQQFDAIRAATLLADADDLFDAWRDF